ncbi:MAG: hypothetical protein ASARMPRED_002704, partial [Alectoria sarmentosa]
MPFNFNPDKELPNLDGKVAFLTGGTAGIGASAVLALAKRNPAKIYFTGRDEIRANAMITKVQSTVPGASVVFIKVDLASLDSVKAAFEQFTSPRLDILICSAGVMATPPALTKDGFEMQFGVNYIAHALFVKLFLPMLLETAELPEADVRIVILTSLGYRLAPKAGIDFKNVKTKQDTGPGAPWTRYGQSKTAGLLMAVELARRYPQITSTAIHPGVINTGLVSGLPLGAKLVVHIGCFVQGVKMIPPEEGCYNMLWAAACDKRGIINGEFVVGVGGATDEDEEAPPSSEDPDPPSEPPFEASLTRLMPAFVPS